MGTKAKGKTRTKAARTRGSQRKGATRISKTGKRNGNDYLAPITFKTLLSDLPDEMKIDSICSQPAFARCGASRTGEGRKWNTERQR